jgi:hypothetical protein
MKKRAFIKYTEYGKIIPGSMIVTQGSFPSKEGRAKWYEVPMNKCCSSDPFPSNCMEMDITTLQGINPESYDLILDFEVFESTSSTITVDWGDGTQYSGVINYGEAFSENHIYPERDVKYTIRVCFGNIENIRRVKSFTNSLCSEGVCIYPPTEVRGIKNFTSLVDIEIDYHNFPSFDVSGITTLEELDLSNNALLSYVNFGNLPVLDDLALDSCNFSGAFDFTIFPAIERIGVHNNNFTSIDASNLLNLQFLIVYNNPNLSNLDITGSPSIDYIIVNDCAIPTLLVDSILVQLDTNGITDGSAELSGGTNGIPTATGLAAKASLEGKGWTVNVNS